MDAEDRELIAVWALKAGVVCAGVVVAALVLGLAVRLFFYVVGI